MNKEEVEVEVGEEEEAEAEAEVRGRRRGKGRNLCLISFWRRKGLVLKGTRMLRSVLAS